MSQALLQRAEQLIELKRGKDVLTLLYPKLGDPDMDAVTLHVLLSAGQVQVGDHAKAESHAREALRIAPDNERGLLLLGIALWEQGQVREATQPLQTLTKIDGSNAHYHTVLSHLYKDLGWVDWARYEAEWAIQLAPEEAESHRALGTAAAMREEGAVAIAAFHKALELDPHNLKARLQLATLQFARGDIRGLRGHVRLLSEAPGNPLSVLFLDLAVATALGRCTLVSWLGVFMQGLAQEVPLVGAVATLATAVAAGVLSYRWLRPMVQGLGRPGTYFRGALRREPQFLVWAVLLIGAWFLILIDVPGQLFTGSASPVIWAALSLIPLLLCHAVSWVTRRRVDQRLN